MSPLRMIAILLIVAGIALAVYGNFSYTKATHEAKIGPFDFSVKEKRVVTIPIWPGIAAIVAGVILLAVPKRT